jgi:hypothetical protein
MAIPTSFGVSGSSGVLGSWLSSSTTGATGALAALATSASSTTPSTSQALLAGKLTTSQQRILAAVGDNSGPLTIPWNTNGTEPSIVAGIHNAGWLKLDKKVLTNGKVTGGVYELTKVGTAIYNRTGGGNVSGADTSALTSTDTNGTATSSTTAALQSSVASITSVLGSLGISV